MNATLRKAIILFKLKLKFATVSLAATAFDFLFYSFFVLLILPDDGSPSTRQKIIIVTAVGAFIGMLINFFMQKRFVFDLQRKVSVALMLAIGVSLGGVFLNTSIVAFLSDYDFFLQSKFHKILPKITATGLVFFYNFYLKRYVFEKRFFSVD